MDNIYKIIFGDVEEIGHKRKEIRYIRTNATSANDIVSAYNEGKRLLDADMESYGGECKLSQSEIDLLQEHYPLENFEAYFDECDEAEGNSKGFRTIRFDSYYYFWQLFTHLGNPDLRIQDADSPFPQLLLDGIYISESAEGAGNFHVEFKPSFPFPTTAEDIWDSPDLTGI